MQDILARTPAANDDGGNTAATPGLPPRSDGEDGAHDDLDQFESSASDDSTDDDDDIREVAVGQPVVGGLAAGGDDFEQKEGEQEEEEEEDEEAEVSELDVQRAFDLFDIDGNGLLTAMDLVMYFASSTELSRENAVALIAAGDPTGKQGGLDRAQFAQLLSFNTVIGRRSALPKPPTTDPAIASAQARALVDWCGSCVCLCVCQAGPAASLADASCVI